MILFGNINRGLEEYHATPGAILVDVREVDEFASGHIPNAVNAPLNHQTDNDPERQAPVPLLSARNTQQAGGEDAEEHGVHGKEHRRNREI